MLTKSDIEKVFAALDEALQHRGVESDIVIAGGAAVVLLLGIRMATKDVDAIRVRTANQQAFQDAIREVAVQFGLPSDWLNDRATAFAMGVEEGTPLWKGEALRVVAAGFEQLVGMKLSALRDDIDFEDARHLLRLLPGDKEAIWARIVPYLVPGMEDWKRQNFDVIWEMNHAAE